jgi:hypothetical protein
MTNSNTPSHSLTNADGDNTRYGVLFVYPDGHKGLYHAAGTILSFNLENAIKQGIEHMGCMVIRKQTCYGSAMDHIEIVPIDKNNNPGKPARRYKIDIVEF